jgi:hypothetical protein
MKILFIPVLILTSTVAFASGKAPGLTVTVTVAATAEKTAPRLASGLAGFSYEKSKMESTLFRGDDDKLVSLFRLLGPGLLRIGGNSVDKTEWTTEGTKPAKGQITRDEVVRLNDFLVKTGWKVLYGLNFASNTPERLAAEAGFVARTLGDRLYGFEIGNEPDLYYHNGLRCRSYRYADFLKEWQSMASIVRIAAPGVALTGPASASHVADFTVPFGRDERNSIVLLTQHYYRGDGRKPSSTVAMLLQRDPYLLGELSELKSASSGIRDGFRLTEANSFYHGGAPHRSNAYGTALWALDFLMLTSHGGSTGVNFHGGGQGPTYTPIADNGQNPVEARPVFYGMLMAALASPGQFLETSLVPHIGELKVWAVQGPDGSRSVILINDSPSKSFLVKLTPGIQSTFAKELDLRGPGLTNPEGTTLGKSTIGANGSWSPEWLVISSREGSFVLDMPPGSADLIRF